MISDEIVFSLPKLQEARRVCSVPVISKTGEILSAFHLSEQDVSLRIHMTET